MKSLINKARRFMSVEDGLVTVEWVALSAGMVVAAIAVGFIVMQTTYTEGTNVGNNIVGTANSVFGATGSKLVAP
jgi:preprotein translocase subunit SecG